ncbi:DUF7210 family protein [Stenotrophomonas pigmentata]|uniref:DUF7210 family protein n=1 Tax=Stenotrophomonas pigmentata TaxID=3055080 RepID=UPI0026EADBB1|nr:hypothetical protein [Stenotrophomonas sp. 610A2]
MNSNTSTTGSASSTPSAKRKVRIFRPHTHEGKRLTPGPDGIEIEVNEPDAKFLESVGATKRPDVAEVPVGATAGGIRPQG